jgi:hypothetical protein
MVLVMPSYPWKQSSRQGRVPDRIDSSLEVKLIHARKKPLLPRNPASPECSSLGTPLARWGPSLRNNTSNQRHGDDRAEENEVVP